MPAELPPSLTEDEHRALDRLYAGLAARADHVIAGPAHQIRHRARQRRQRRLATVVVMVLVAGAAAFGTLRFGRELVQPAPPTPKPTVNFVPLRSVGEVPMELGPEFDGGQRFVSSTIVDRFAYVAAWHWPGPLRVGALDLASGQPHFATVDLGQWQEVRTFDGLAEGLVVFGTAAGATTQMLTVLDPASGSVRWQQPIADHRCKCADTEYTAVRLYHDALVVAATSFDHPADLRAFDWSTGAVRWQATIDAHEVWTPRRWEPGPDAADPFDAAPGDTRLVGIDRGGEWASIIDITTGTVTRVRVLSPDDRRVGSGFLFGANVMVVGGQLFALIYGREATASAVINAYTLVRQPIDGSAAPTVLWSSGPREGGSDLTPCGQDRLCLTLAAWSPGPDDSTETTRIAILDARSGAEVGQIPNTVMARGFSWADRYLDPKGRLYDMSARLLGDPAPNDFVRWLTPGSVLTLSYDVRPSLDVAPTATVRGKSTIDGTGIMLGRIPIAYGGLAVHGNYLVVPYAGGFQAWQFAAG